MKLKLMKGTLVAVLLLSLLLVACQPTTPATTEPVEPEPQATLPAAEPTQPPPPASPEIIEITYMRQADNPDIELDYIKEFEAANPGIKVIVDSVPSNDTYNKLVLTTNAGNPPDVFMTFWTADAVSNDLIYSLVNLNLALLQLEQAMHSSRALSMLSPGGQVLRSSL